MAGELVSAMPPTFPWALSMLIQCSDLKAAKDASKATNDPPKGPLTASPTIAATPKTPISTPKRKASDMHGSKNDHDQYVPRLPSVPKIAAKIGSS